MPSPSSLQRARTLRLMRTLAIAGLLAASVVVAGCGGSGSAASSGASASTSSDNDREAARLKLNQCLRQQGVNVPDTGGAGGGGGGAQLSEADREKRRIAIEGPCKEFQSSAGGNLTDEQRQEFQDAFTKFAACMRQNGVDVPDPTAGGGGGAGGGGIRRLLDQDDPKVKAATTACQDQLPQRGQGGPRGGGAAAQ